MGNQARDNRVYLLVGQRGSGKTAYGQRIIANQPKFCAVSRDEILVRLFGSVHTSPYTGSSHYAEEIMHRLLRQRLLSRSGVRMILDCWTGDSADRKKILENLRGAGATRVTALYFVTPLKLVQAWFWLKPGVARIGEMKARKGEGGLLFFLENAPERDYRLFHELASDIDSDGFDKVVRIDPTQDVILLD